jgi:hypothetical protein
VTSVHTRAASLRCCPSTTTRRRSPRHRPSPRRPLVGPTPRAKGGRSYRGSELSWYFQLPRRPNRSREASSKKLPCGSCFSRPFGTASLKTAYEAAEEGVSNEPFVCIHYREMMQTQGCARFSCPMANCILIQFLLSITFLSTMRIFFMFSVSSKSS